jgi:hypothetical protein
VSAALASRPDGALLDLVAEAPVAGSGIGGTAKLVTVGGEPVFVKCVPLTDVERRPEHAGSTANLFGLPVWCQYGVGSPGFGVWRELVATAWASSRVTGGRSEGFPLLYHWRILDGPAWAGPRPDELADVERAVGYWHGSAAVRGRLDAIARSTATVALFLEYLPLGLPEWLAGQVAAGAEAAEAAITSVEHALIGDVAAMNRAGLFHFDAHFGNIRTDGERLFLADFGLATSPRFDLSDAESTFLAANRTHDACHTVTRLVDWLATEVAGAPYGVERDELIGRCARGEEPDDLPPAAAAVIRRHAPIAIVINEFYRRLHHEDRRTPYPLDAIDRALGHDEAMGVTEGT